MIDQMDAFDRQLASVVLRRVGPSRPVDDAAIFTAITATQSPKLRFQSMFSATRFVVAGVIVALFGGFLLAGVLTQPSDKAGLAAVTDSPDPTTELLPGVDLVTEEVGSGIYRVLGDGVRDLSTSVWDVAVSGSGDVWIDRLADGTSRVSRLGSEQEHRLSADEVVPIRGPLSVDKDGSIRAGSERSGDEMTFVGEAWVPAKARLALGGGGTADAVAGDGFWVSAAWDALEVVHETADGLEPAHLDLYSTPRRFRLTDAGGGVMAAPGSDGTVWVSLSTPGSRLFKLARFDGMKFDLVKTGGPSGPSSTGLDDSGQNVLTAIAEAPDGTLWVSSWLRHADILYVWSWDGVSWTAYDPVETKAGKAWSEVWAGDLSSTGGGPRTGAWFAPDGSIWFDGLVHFDGERFTPLDTPVASAAGTTRVSAISVAPDGMIWLVMVSGYPEEGCEPSITSPPCGLSAEGLYLITPEAVAGLEQGRD